MEEIEHYARDIQFLIHEIDKSFRANLVEHSEPLDVLQGDKEHGALIVLSKRGLVQYKLHVHTHTPNVGLGPSLKLPVLRFMSVHG